MAVVPAMSFAALPLLDSPLPVDLGSSLTGLPELPLDLQGLLNTTTSPADGTPSSGYNGSAEGLPLAVNLPANLGGLELNSAYGAVNSEGGLLSDNSGTPEDESQATSAGAVSVAMLTSPLGAFGLGGASSFAPPAGGGPSSLFDMTLPGLGAVKIGFFKSVSSATATDNALSLFVIEIESLDMQLAIPVMQSGAESAEHAASVDSFGSTDLLASEPGQPLVLGEGLLAGQDLASVSLLNSGSASGSNGNDAAQTNNYWTIADLTAAGMPLLAFNDKVGLQLAGTELMPAPVGENSSFLAVEDPLLGLGGIYLGEKQATGDGATYTSGSANILRIGLLGVDDLLLLGHAGSSGGAAPGTFGEKPDDPNPGIGPGPKPTPQSQPQPSDSSSSGSGPDQSFARAGGLPFTGMSLLIILGWLAALALGVTHFLNPRRRNGTA